MAAGKLNTVLRHLRRASSVAESGPQHDGQLLERFVAHRDEAAFEALLRRHGPMVLGVCRRVLHDAHHAEDAFQSAFLVLARKAGAIARRELLGNWLYGVAYRAALEVRAARRRVREKQVSALPEPEAAGPPELLLDLQPILDQELSRLPEKYRSAVVLCDLEGRTRRDAAAHLGIPEGTLSGRLTTAHRLLARRLERRGFGHSAGALALPPPEAASEVVSPSLTAATVKAAAGVIPAEITGLTEGVINVMLLNKTMNAAAGLLLMIGLLGAAAAVAISQDAPKPTTAAVRPVPKKEGTPMASQAKRFENAAGWTWYQEEPRPRNTLGSSFSMGDVEGGGISALFQQDKYDALVVYLAYRATATHLEYRPVAFDSRRKRHPLALAQGMGHGDVRLRQFRLDPKVLPAEKAVYLGFELLTAEGSKVAAKEAAARARKAGVEVLPFPEVGKAYDFTLTALDGKKVRGRDLRGKVVLIDCWATWCAPCLAKMPELKALYEKHHKEGLEVVGVCFDHDARKARQAIERLKLAWPQVLVPAEDEARKLWGEASGVGALPRLLLVGRDGLLQADAGLKDLEGQVRTLLARRPAEKEKR